MNSHLSDEQLIGYVHRTLTDAQREAIDQHLATCPHCRTRLADHEALQRRIRHSLLADLKAVQPSPGMTFSAIPPRLKRPKRFARFWPRSGQLFHSVTAVAALAGLVIALVALAESVSRPAVGLIPIRAGSLPTVACFLFAVPVMGNYYESRTVPSRLILSGVLAFILWVGTAIVGLQVMVVVRNVFCWVLLQVLSDIWSAIGLSNWALIPLGILWVALVVGGGEYHYKRVGQRSSWKLFGWTVALELLILIASYIF